MSTTVPRQDGKITPTCDKCRNCIDKVFNPDTGETWYYCSIDKEFIAESWAMDTTLDCDAYVEELDDNQTEESIA